MVKLSFNEKTEKLSQKTVFVLNWSFEQHNDEFNNEEEITEIIEKEGGFVVLDDVIEHNQKAIAPFFRRGARKI